MKKSNPDAIQPDMLANGTHYYSSGAYLREKHRLAGDKYVKWSLARIPTWTGAKILDAGGGWGRYIWALIDDYGVHAADIVLTDISAGMLQTAAEEARQRNIVISTTVGTIEALPFPDKHFDIVMANKVLYHLNDMRRGVQELTRVLKLGGYLLATTNSDKITATIITLHYQALEKLGIAFTPEPPSPFSMENGSELLAAHFQQVDAYYYEDEKFIDDAAAMHATYETIGRYRNLLARADIPEASKRALPGVVEQLAQDIIDREGVLRSPELMGAFVCR